MVIKNFFWVFEKALNEKFCNKIISFCLKKQKQHIWLKESRKLKSFCFLFFSFSVFIFLIFSLNDVVTNCIQCGKKKLLRKNENQNQL